MIVDSMKRISALLLAAGFLLLQSQLVRAESREVSDLLVKLRKNAPEITSKALKLAITAVRCASKGAKEEPRHLALIDYSLPSSVKRFWLVDLKLKKLLREEFVAHGRESGDGQATRFSNEIGSLQSSLGLFRAGEAYSGQHGYSMRLHGLEPGFNDRALERNIVVHGADYVSESFISQWNRLGRSWGCPALPVRSVRSVIDTLKEGAYLFAYYPDEQWLTRSPLLNSCARTL